MSWFQTGIKVQEDRSRASVAEVVECFQDARPFLTQLALLITGDSASAEQSAVNACEMTAKGHRPFRDWLLEWAKVATITDAISKCAENIRGCEVAYRGQGCSHAEHMSLTDAEERGRYLAILLSTDISKIIAELDALSRAVLVLRLSVRSSIQDCVLRLNVGRAAVLAANCRAMTWLLDLQLQPALALRPGSPAEDRAFSLSN